MYNPRQHTIQDTHTHTNTTRHDVMTLWLEITYIYTIYIYCTALYCTARSHTWIEVLPVASSLSIHSTFNIKLTIVLPPSEGAWNPMIKWFCMRSTHLGVLHTSGTVARLVLDLYQQQIESERVTPKDKERQRQRQRQRQRNREKKTTRTYTHGQNHTNRTIYKIYPPSNPRFDTASFIIHLRHPPLWRNGVFAATRLIGKTHTEFILRIRNQVIDLEHNRAPLFFLQTPQQHTITTHHNKSQYIISDMSMQCCLM